MFYMIIYTPTGAYISSANDIMKPLYGREDRFVGDKKITKNCLLSRQSVIQKLTHLRCLIERAKKYGHSINEDNLDLFKVVMMKSEEIARYTLDEVSVSGFIKKEEDRVKKGIDSSEIAKISI